MEDFDIFRNYSLEQNEHYIPSFSARKIAVESKSPNKKNNKQQNHHQFPVLKISFPDYECLY